MKINRNNYYYNKNFNMEYNMTLLPEYFDLIKTGKKIYEIRLNKNKKNYIKINDYIIFSKRPDLKEKIKVIVEKIDLFPTFLEMINKLNKNEIGFKNKSNEEIIKIYKDIYPNEEEEKNYGVIAYKIKLIK